MTCILTDKDGKPDWCDRHNTYHVGRLKELALDRGSLGKRYRRLWDRQGKPDKGIATVKMTASGIGDNLLGLTSVEGLRRDGYTVYYACHPNTVPFVKLFDVDIVALDGPHEGTVFDPYASYNDRELKEKSELPRWEYYATYCNTKAALPEAPDLSLLDEYKDAVVLVPFSMWGNRNWHTSLWLHLEDRLLAEGRRVVILDADLNRVKDFRSEKFCGRGAMMVASLLASASCVVGNDSGMQHLSGLLRTPTVVLCGPSDGDKIFGIYGCVKSLKGSIPCSGCYWSGRHFTDVCIHHCAAINTIAPVQVLDAIRTTARKPEAERKAEVAPKPEAKRQLNLERHFNKTFNKGCCGKKARPV